MDASRCQIGSGRWACAAALLLAPLGAAEAQPRPVMVQAELGAAAHAHRPDPIWHLDASMNRLQPSHARRRAEK